MSNLDETHIEIMMLVSSQRTLTSALFITDRGSFCFIEYLSDVSIGQDTDKRHEDVLSHGHTRSYGTCTHSADPILLVGWHSIAQTILLLQLGHPQE